MSINWNDDRKDLLSHVSALGAEIPDTLKGYKLLADSANKQGILDKKTQELIALAVAVTTRCDGCISIHSHEALSAGATKQEISAALAVAIALHAGAALVYSSQVIDAIGE